jgi:hypothetical protein
MLRGSYRQIARISDLVRRSRFVVGGTIRALKEATMMAVSVTDNTAVVTIQEVFMAPPSLGDYTGKEITVQLAELRRAKAGLQAVFFANSWLYGSSIAVIEVGRIEGEWDSALMHRLIADAELRRTDENLEARIARAVLVVVGRVEKTEPAREEQSGRPFTEHDPDWWEALVLVESVEKGKLSGPTITVLFPKSLDELWLDSPKFCEGQHGIWILQLNQKEKGWPSMRRSGYTALDPLDFQAAGQLDRTRALINRSRSPQ